MLDEEKYINHIIKTKFNRPLKMTEEDDTDFKKGDVSHICDKQYTEKGIRVRDHCHVSGIYRGFAHQDCN